MTKKPKLKKLESKEVGVLWTQEEILKDTERLREAARARFVEDGGHGPITYVFATKHPQTGESAKAIILVPSGHEGDFDEEKREYYAGMLRFVAHASNAVGIVFISEAWTAVSEKDEPDWEGSLADHPNRKEILMLTCEHSRFGIQMWTAEIKRDDDGKPELGPWGESGGWQQIKGRFTHLLPQVN